MKKILYTLLIIVLSIANVYAGTSREITNITPSAVKDKIIYAAVKHGGQVTNTAYDINSFSIHFNTRENNRNLWWECDFSVVPSGTNTLISTRCGSGVGSYRSTALNLLQEKLILDRIVRYVNNTPEYVYGFRELRYNYCDATYREYPTWQIIFPWRGVLWQDALHTFKKGDKILEINGEPLRKIDKVKFKNYFIADKKEPLKIKYRKKSTKTIEEVIIKPHKLTKNELMFYCFNPYSVPY